MQDYRQLKVWEKAQAVAVEVRRSTHHLQRAGYRGLRSQMVRAAESVVFNIVEGCGTVSAREFGRFLEIAIKSTSELQAQLELARNYGVLSHAAWLALTGADVEVRRMLCGLRKRVLAERN